MKHSPIVEASPLTIRYRMLQRLDRQSDDCGSEQERLRMRELDRLYRQIHTQPVHNLADAIEKLAFADHCLEEEDDAAEATHLIRQVTAALLTIHASEGPRPSV